MPLRSALRGLPPAAPELPAALAAKRDQVGEHLVRIGHLTGVDVREPDPAVAIYGYRNKMEYSVAPGTDGAAIGIHARGRWDEVIDVRACLLATALGNAVRETRARWAVPRRWRPTTSGRRRATCATSWCARAIRPARCW